MQRETNLWRAWGRLRGVCMLLLALWGTTALAAEPNSGVASSGLEQPSSAAKQGRPDIQREENPASSRGCITCHTATDQPTMHASPAVTLGCTDCHGGDAAVAVASGTRPGSVEYRQSVERAHILPRDKKAWRYPSSANPSESYTLLNREDPAFIRFVNPSDYRVVDQTCGSGNCHADIVAASLRSMHSTGAMFWGGASYNNGILPNKRYFLGESYDHRGHPAILHGPRVPEGLKAFAASADILPDLTPLPAWESVKPADIFRVFERGGRNAGNLFPETGLPDATGKLERLEEPGRPDIRQSNRGLGTGARISIPVLNITKTRLNDPLTWFMGTNDQPGDYRQSGCAACHVVYANDREKRHSGPYAEFGHDGESRTLDPTISKNESGHPIRHTFTRAIPTSQCMVCHLHQPNMFMNSFLGYTMWDYEADAPAMWPKKQQYPSMAETRQVLDRNPEGAAPRGLWADVKFLSGVSDLNPKLNDTQFADYHGHGWNFRAVFKRDRQGNLLDQNGAIVPNTDPDKFHKAVLLSSIHLDKGMHCVDCHFSQDNHGNGYIYGEVAAAVEVDCKDCHGTATGYPNLYASGPAALGGGTDMTTLRTPDGRRRFEWINGELFQRSMLYPDREWRVSLVKDTVTPGNPHYNPRAARAKLMGSSTATLEWGAQVPPGSLAHSESKMECYSCHSSWTTSCGGCHLPIEANWKTARHHYEGGETRNYATYNPQVARDDMYVLGLREPSAGGRIAPVRSSSALVLSSTNSNREHIYVQQPPISASGYSSQAFNPHYPHTERTTETKTCSDCHLSKPNDNNAVVAQLLGLGTNFVNFVGLNAYVGGEGAVSAIKVTEWDEPQAVIGSYLHQYAYPDWYARHQRKGQRLQGAAQHRAGTARCIQLRGEYLYVAEGTRGMRVYDVASIDNKGVSQRLITAPASPFGQNTHIASKNATCVGLPTNQPIDPPRSRTRQMQDENLEKPIHPLYDYAYITDAEEGLILTNVDTLSDREPRNNFLKRALTWNPGGILRGARHITIGGSVLYITTPAALVVIRVDSPLEPKLLATVALPDPRATALQFRYLFVTDARGLETIDVTQPENPQLVPNNVVAIKDAQRVSVARTYAYVAAGAEGLVIVDATVPTALRLQLRFDANGRMRDARDVVVASTNASLFGYVADGRGGLKVLQLTSPETQPNFYGFSPEPCPQLIAYYPTARAALSLSKGLERDRAVDETGHQIAVFGRRGSGPLTLEQMQRMYLDGSGKPWVVSDTASGTTLADQPRQGASTCRPPRTTLADAGPARP